MWSGILQVLFDMKWIWKNSLQQTKKQLNLYILRLFLDNVNNTCTVVADFRVIAGTPFFSEYYTRLQNLRALYTSGILQGQLSGRI